jgi:proton-dependent oligopeptide transporter, POT family
MRAILVVFMTQYLRSRSGALAPMSENDADKWYHVFRRLELLLPHFRRHPGRRALGQVPDDLLALDRLLLRVLRAALDDTRLGLALGLSLIAIGSGGIKPCVSANVGDQFGPSNQHLISRAFGWFYFSINAGSSFSILLIPWLLQHYGSRVAFAVPGILMVVATLIFWMGRRKFVHIAPGGRTFLRDTFSREGFLPWVGWRSSTCLRRRVLVALGPERRRVGAAGRQDGPAFRRDHVAPVAVPGGERDS